MKKQLIASVLILLVILLVGCSFSSEEEKLELKNDQLFGEGTAPSVPADSNIGAPPPLPE